jgi:hypothetical protein
LEAGWKRGGERFALGRMVPDSEPMEIREEKRREEDRTFFGSSNPLSLFRLQVGV